MRRWCALPALLLTAASGPHSYVIAPAGSEVSARVAFLGLGSKTARFPKVSGSVVLSPDRNSAVDLKVAIDATALTAPDAVTQARLKGPKFFAVDRHPTILFEGERMDMTGDRDAQISGHITARGVKRPATLKVQFTEPPRGARAAPLRLTGSTVIDRYDFGMKAYPLIVGRKVTITLTAALAPAG